MSAVRNFERVESGVQAVQFIEGDLAAEQVIRGWTNLPLGEVIGLPEGTWVVKLRDDPRVHLVHDEAFKLDFREVIATTSEETTDDGA